MKLSILLIVALLLSANEAATKADEYRPPRLEGGRPDLQGVWMLSNLTPLERPPDIDTLIISPSQASAIGAEITAQYENSKLPGEGSEFHDARQLEPIRGKFHSSIVIEPSDGRLPSTASFGERIKELVSQIFSNTDRYEERPGNERCMSASAQPPMRTLPMTNLHQIVQTRDRIVFSSEFLHEARIVRMNAAHNPAALKSWTGDSVGWWDQDTLVVETKHFAPGSEVRGSPQYVFLISPQATVLERFTLVSEDELLYEFTVDDPTYYTSVWKGLTHFLRNDERMFEYACHEGNYSLTHILQSARVGATGK
jgi:hypothetical protein